MTSKPTPELEAFALALLARRDARETEANLSTDLASAKEHSAAMRERVRATAAAVAGTSSFRSEDHAVEALAEFVTQGAAKGDCANCGHQRRNHADQIDGHDGSGCRLGMDPDTGIRPCICPAFVEASR